jgi:murein L,D-transpeptidase YafK
MLRGKLIAAATLLIAVAIGAVFASRVPMPAVSAAMPVDPIRVPLTSPRVVIRKAARELALYDGDKLLRKFPVALASNASGDKEREGDRRTPEGTFYICTRNGNSRFWKFLGLSYPAPEDAAGGLAAGMITTAESDAILEAHRRKSCPPWKTALGGEVGIHGGGVGRDWTLGCIALTNEAIDELWEALRLGDPVTIEP